MLRADDRSISGAERLTASFPFSERNSPLIAVGKSFSERPEPPQSAACSGGASSRTPAVDCAAARVRTNRPMKRSSVESGVEHSSPVASLCPGPLRVRKERLRRDPLAVSLRYAQGVARLHSDWFLLHSGA